MPVRGLIRMKLEIDVGNYGGVVFELTGFEWMVFELTKFRSCLVWVMTLCALVVFSIIC